MPNREALPDRSGTQALIRPILVDTYGGGDMTRAFARHLADKIDSFVCDDEDHPLKRREDMIWRTCWDWFSGGTTAENVAQRIERALAAREALNRGDS